MTLDSAINFAHQVRFSYKGLYWWYGLFPYSLNVLLRPLVYLALYALFGRYVGGAGAQESIAIGLVAFGIHLTIASGTLGCAAQERWNGTLPFLLASAGSRLRILVSWGFMHFPSGVLTGVIASGVALLFVESSAGQVNWGVLALSIALLTLSGFAFYLFFAPFAVVFAKFGLVAAVGPGLMLTLSGAIIPLDSLPAGWQALGHLLPVTNGLVALRGAFDDMALAEAGPYLLLELATAGAYGLLSYLLFSLVEVYSRRTGALERAPA
jgi:hypothetical protein